MGKQIAPRLQETLFSHALLEKLIAEFGLYPETVSLIWDGGRHRRDAEARHPLQRTRGLQLPRRL